MKASEALLSLGLVGQGHGRPSDHPVPVLGSCPPSPLLPHLPWVMPCLSREPGPALRWVQLRVDVGQKPVEHPTTQSPLQLQAFCAVQLFHLGTEKDTGHEMEKAYCTSESTWWGRVEMAEAEGLGQNEDTKTSFPGLEREERVRGKRVWKGQDRMGLP